MSTHQQLLYHIVFSTKNRKPYLRNDKLRDEVFAYMAGTCKQLEGFALIVGGYYDHVHLLTRIPAKIAVSKFIGELKANTSKHINQSNERILKFGWQDGYGAFSVSPSQKEKAYRYIQNQMEHHAKEDFQEEYIRLLNAHEVKYDGDFVFD